MSLIHQEFKIVVKFKILKILKTSLSKSMLQYHLVRVYSLPLLMNVGFKVSHKTASAMNQIMTTEAERNKATSKK